MTRITIQEKKITVTRMFVAKLNKTLELMNNDLEQEKGELLKALLAAHFEMMRCDSGNLNEILEGNRFILNLFFDGFEL